MTDDVVVHGGALGAPIDTAAADPFETVFRPAKPALDAFIDMRRPLEWLHQRRRSNRPLFDPNQAVQLLDTIPDGDHLTRAGALFLEAEEQPAPESWLHLAIGLMFDSEPGAVNFPDATRCAVADSAYRDPQVWEDDYEPGFSAPVVVRAIREARLQGALSPGVIVKLLMKHRRLFKTLNADLDALMQVRWDAEDAIENNPKRLLLNYDPDNDVPF
jgi:hypothetical protein